MIDLHKLHVFHIVAQEGSFSAAAERLYITQSAVSQQIKELEAGLGQTLFDRGWRGVRLTLSGEILAETAAQVFDLIARAETALTDVAQLTSGRITISATQGVSSYLAPLWMQEFRAEHPNFTVALNTGVTGKIVDDVLAHRSDLGVIEGELEESLPPRLGHLVLDEIEQILVVGFKHPFWDRDRVDLADLTEQSFIMRQQQSQSRIWLERTLKRGGIDPHVAAEFDNFEAMKRAVAAGTCIAVLPPYVIESELKQHVLHAVPVEGKPLVRELKLIWNRDTQASPITRRFLTFLSQHYPAVHVILNPREGRL